MWPDEVSAREITDPIADSLGADYLVVVADGLEDAGAAFAAYRGVTAPDGITQPAYVRYATVVDSFADGGAFPLRDLLSHADTAWPVAPAYVLIIGGMAIPTDTAWNGVWDQVYGQAPGADTLLRRVGRIPTGTTGTALTYLDKVKSWEASAPTTAVLLVADDSCQGASYDAITHAAQAYQVKALLDSAGIGTEFVDMAALAPSCPHPSDELLAVRAAVHDALADAPSFVSFHGHGAPNVWTDEAVLTVDDVPGVESPSVYTLMTSSANTINADTLLARELLLRDGGGAVAVIGSGADSWAGPNLTFAMLFYGDLAAGSRTTVGEAFMQAFNTNPMTPLSKYMILGDPALLIN